MDPLPVFVPTKGRIDRVISKGLKKLSFYLIFDIHENQYFYDSFATISSSNNMRICLKFWFWPACIKSIIKATSKQYPDITPNSLEALTVYDSWKK